MCAELRLYLFGSPRLEQDGTVIEIDTRKAIAMLAYLVLGEAGPTGGYSRDALAALLYPDSDQTSARGALRRTLSALRKGLKQTILETERERVTVNLETLWVDVLVFQENLRQLKQHKHIPGQACEDCRQRLKESIELYVADFMAGFSLRDSFTFDDWQFYQADTLRQELAGALENYTYELAAQGDYEAAILQARHWLSLDLLREEAQRRLMLLYAWNGQRSAALRQYRECVRVLDKELGVPPLEETTELYQRLLENRLPSTPHESPGETLTAAQPQVEIPAAPSSEVLSTTTNELEVFPLVGRSVEWQILLQAYQATGIKGNWFVLEGEAGIGKTRLADEFLQQVQAAGAAILRSRCYEGETGLAYAPFLDGMNAFLKQPDVKCRLQALPPAGISPAVPLLPVLRETFKDLPPAPVMENPGAQALFFDALRMIVAHLLEAGGPSAVPGVLFLDDLQWADAASLDLLSFLIRRMKGVFILTAWRSDAVPLDHRLRQLLSQAGREEKAASLVLPRLKPEDMAGFFGDVQADLDLKPNFIRHFYAETEGNPFFVVAYAQSIREELKASEDFEWQLPHSVRDLLQTRLSGVSGMNWQILTAASIIGRAFTFGILKEVSGRSELEVIEGLEALLEQNLIVEQRIGDAPASEVRYDFTHDKIRSLVSEQTSLARRRLLHQRAAGAYAAQARQRQEAWSQAAAHYQLSGQLSEAAACFRQAGEVARSLFANREALDHFQNALACDDPEPVSLHEAIGDLYALMGEYLAALTHYENAAALCRAEQLPGIEHKLGVIHGQRGHWELAECHYQSALEEIDEAPAVEDSSPGQRAMIYADWSLAVHRQGDTQRALELAERSLELAQTSQTLLAAAQAYNILGILERVNGNPKQAIEHLQRSLEIASSLADIGSQAAAMNNLAKVYADTGQPEQAIQLSEQALALCIQRGDRHRAAALHNNLADLFHAAGNQEKTMEHLRQAVVIFAEIEGWGEVHSAAHLTGQASQTAATERLPEVWKLSEW